MPGTARTGTSAKMATGASPMPVEGGGECLEGKPQVLWSPVQMQGRLHGCASLAVTWALSVGLCAWGFMCCCCQFEIPNYVCTRDLCFPFAPDPQHSVASPREGNRDAASGYGQGNTNGC